MDGGGKRASDDATVRDRRPQRLMRRKLERVDSHFSYSSRPKHEEHLEILFISFV